MVDHFRSMKILSPTVTGNSEVSDLVHARVSQHMSNIVPVSGGIQCLQLKTLCMQGLLSTGPVSYLFVGLQTAFI